MMARHLLALLALIAASATVIAEPAGTGTVSGTVATSAGEPVAGAEVGLRPVNVASANAEQANGDRPVERQQRRAGMARTRTDAKGRFTFADVQPGEYRIYIRSREGRAMSSAKVEPGEHLDLPIPVQPTEARGDRSRPNRRGETNTPPAPGERHATRLRIGDEAPDFTLPTPNHDPDGKARTVTLSSFRGHKPVVLVFGSFTCPPFRDRMPPLNQLAKSYADRVQFLMVYIREAHPDSVIYVKQDDQRVLTLIEQTVGLGARSLNAQRCAATLDLAFPAVVDKEDNKVNAAYAGWPSRIIAIDQQGRIAFDGGPGPGGFQPARVEEWLKANVKEAQAGD